MRIMLVICALSFPSIASYGQRIEKSEIDKFTKQRRIETTLVNLKNTLFEGLWIYVRSVDSSIFFILGGRGNAADVIGSEDKAIFLLDNDSTVTIKPTGIQSYDIGLGTAPNSYKHQYYISSSQLTILSRHNVKSIRKYGAGGYVDIDIPSKHQDEIRNTAVICLNEYQK